MSYVPTCLLEAVVGIIPIGIGLWKNKKLTVYNTMWWYCMLVYMLVVIMITFFSRESGSRRGIDLQFFSTWGVSTQAKAYVIENIFMFLPLGVLRAIRKKSNDKIFLKEICLYIVISCIIEGVQLITGRGYCQLDDVIMNTLGGILGYIFIKFLNTIWRKMCERN